jgi:beta-galactosidase
MESLHKLKNIMRSTGVIKILILFSFSLLIGLGCQNSLEKQSRTRLNFNSGWKFIKEDVEDARNPDFDDSNWRQLDLPHDWGIEGPFTQEVNFKGGYLPYPGSGWYRKSFNVPSDAKCVLIEFDGIMRNSKIWLNGEYVGGWPYGYTSFAIDLSEKIKRGGENLIAVRVENQDSSSRWYPGSGIYRNVWLTYTNTVHIAHWGTYITTPRITKEEADVKARITIRNKEEKEVKVEIETSISDKSGYIITQKKQDINIEANKELEVIQNLVISNPKLWDIENPDLYRAVTIISRNGIIHDEYETPFGIRKFHFDAEKGFFLNGKHIKIRGVNLHHGLGPLGAAVNKRAIERQLEIMKEMGVNAIRTAHNPPAPEQLDLCDNLGLLVIDETFDTWNEAKYGVPNDYSIWFDEWAIKDTEALLKRDRNHPSVILWSIGNEIMNLGSQEGKKNAKMQADVCRKLDPSRPVIAGIHLSTKFDRELGKVFDVFGMNYWQDRYDEIHMKYPGIPLLSTESSATLSSRGEYHFPVKEIYREYYHESKQISSYDLINTGFGALPDVEFKLQEKPWMAGQFVWSGFDYHGEPDPYEDMWPAHSSYFGIVDMCGFKKDRYYLYQSNWTEEPMVHLLPHWNWKGREGEVTPVYVYTNCESAELYVNGESHGKKQKQKGVYRLIWDEVVYQPGSIKAVGYDRNGKAIAEKEINTSAEPAKIVLTTDREVINTDNDLSFVTVSITDSEGNFCPTADNMVEFNINDKGRIVAVGNGNPISHESYQSNKRKAFNGLCLAIIGTNGKKGVIQLEATSPGLKGDIISINIK